MHDKEQRLHDPSFLQALNHLVREGAFSKAVKHILSDGLLDPSNPQVFQDLVSKSTLRLLDRYHPFLLALSIGTYRKRPLLIVSGSLRKSSFRSRWPVVVAPPVCAQAIYSPFSARNPGPRHLFSSRLTPSHALL